MLRRISLKGFKSIKEMDIELHSLNILIGANGTGKSNFLSFFRMLNEMMAGRLQFHISQTGSAQTLLHFGPKITPQMDAQLEFNVDERWAAYSVRLSYASGNTLVFAEETLSFLPTVYEEVKAVPLWVGHLETRVGQSAEEEDRATKALRSLLNRCRVYHFHDTSSTARARLNSYIGDSRWLLPDAGNLAAVLYRLRNENNGSAYHPIIATLRLIAPFFDDFDLAPNGPNKSDITLNWREKESDQIFGPHQLSDGTLRAMCLVTLLMQPVSELPDLIIVDEPELGLHPYALNVIAALIKRAAQHTQVLISTQSSTFLNNFDVDDVIVVNREGKASRFTRLDSTKLETWLEEYNLGEVWEKNIIGGGPH